MSFIGLGLGDKVPDAKTIPGQPGHMSGCSGSILFRRVSSTICSPGSTSISKSGYPAKGGQIVNATLIAAPKHRNSDGEKAAIKEGKTADEIWPDQPNKAAQKDTNARWTVKYSKAKPDADRMVRQRDIAIPAFIGKNHASIDRHAGFIRGWTVTGASAHDGAQLCNVLNRENTGSTVWADTAYRSKKNEAWLVQNGYVSDIHHKKPKGRPMSKATSRGNGRRSTVRAFVEHVFAHQKSRFGLFIRTIGIEPARVKIGMANIVYNLSRYVWHQARRAPA